MKSLKNNTETMKKNYIQPEIIASLRYEMEKPLCGSITGTRSTQYGNFETSSYSNGRWFNEGYSPTDATSVVIAGDDDGDLSSTTKSRGGDWGSIW